MQIGRIKSCIERMVIVKDEKVDDYETEQDSFS